MPRNGRGERHCKPFFTCHCEPKAWQSRWDMGLLRHVVPRNDRRGCHYEPFFYCHCKPFFTCHCKPKAWQSRWDMGLLRHVVPRNDRRGCHYEPFFYCHCEPKAWQSRPSSIVIASRRRGNLGGVRLLRRPSSDGLPRNDKEVCHCGELKPRAQRRGQARQSHNSSYRSRHSLFMPLTNSTFLCLGPAFSCFSLEIALCTSSQTS